MMVDGMLTQQVSKHTLQFGGALASGPVGLELNRGDIILSYQDLGQQSKALVRNTITSVWYVYQNNQQRYRGNMPEAEEFYNRIV